MKSMYLSVALVAAAAGALAKNVPEDTFGTLNPQTFGVSVRPRSPTHRRTPVYASPASASHLRKAERNPLCPTQALVNETLRADSTVAVPVPNLPPVAGKARCSTALRCWPTTLLVSG